MQTLNCEHCGKEFECRSSSGRCWCMDLPPIPKPEDIDPKKFDLAKYTQCLCPKCLELVHKLNQNDDSENTN